MKHFCIAAMLLITSCANRQGVDAIHTDVSPDSIRSAHVTILADLPDSLQPQSFSLATKPTPVKHVITQVPHAIDGGGGLAKFTTFTTDNGLALDAVMCAYCDKDGNLWFGTGGGGVSRYDGKSFVSFSTAHGLVSNNVMCITQDNVGNLWFGTSGGGACRYDGKSFVSFSTGQGLADNNITCIYEDKTGNLWFATSDSGVSRYDGQSFVNFSTIQGLADNNVNCIAQDKNGNLWFGTDSGGVSRYDGKSFVNFTKEQGLVNEHVLSMDVDDAGNLWFGTGNGVSRYDGGSFDNITALQGLGDNRVNRIIHDKDGNLWLGTESGGVSRYDGKSLINFSTKEGLPHDKILSIIEDKKGDLWFSTFGGGVCRYNGQSFVRFSTGQGLAFNSVWSAAEDSAGNIWFGTFGGGVSRYDGKSFVNFSVKQGLTSNNIYSITSDKNGNIWFGAFGGGISKYDGASFVNYTKAQGLTDDRVLSIVEDDSNNFWLGTYTGGVSRFDGQSFVNYTTKQGLANNSVFCILKDKTGVLWLGTYGGGVSRFDGKSFINFSKGQGLASAEVLSIHEDNAGNLWFATMEGLCMMRAADVAQLNNTDNYKVPDIFFKTFTKSDDLPDNVITQVQQLPDGRMAIGTNLGITIFDISEDLERLTNVEIYNTNTGYPIKDINTGQHCLFADGNGILWAGTGSEKTALVRFDYSALNKDTLPPVLAITGLRIDDEPISWYSLMGAQKTDSNATPAYVTEEVTTFGAILNDATRDSILQKYGDIDFDSIRAFTYMPQNLVLPYAHNDITIVFNATETGRPEMVNYQYILEGYDEDWSPVTKQTNATFGNIPEGTYTFKVIAKSPEGVWGQPASYTFKVLPPWYRSWWIYVIYILSFFLALRTIIKWRERRLKADKNKLEYIVAERTSELVKKNVIIEAEKQKSDELLHNILPEEVASELKERGATTAQHYDHVTVLFTDFVNFTIAGERMGSQALVEELHNCFKAFDEIMDKYNIEKIKTIGDAYLAVCGLPTVDERHAENIVNSAKDIRNFMLQRREQLGDKTFEVRIGVHSGDVVAGIVGVKKFAYDIWGDTVNTAARMESNSEAGKINISQTTYELVKDKFTCTYRGEIEAKGKRMLKMYFVNA